MAKSWVEARREDGGELRARVNGAFGENAAAETRSHAAASWPTIRREAIFLVCRGLASPKLLCEF